MRLLKQTNLVNVTESMLQCCTALDIDWADNTITQLLIPRAMIHKKPNSSDLVRQNSSAVLNDGPKYQ